MCIRDRYRDLIRVNRGMLSELGRGIRIPENLEQMLTDGFIRRRTTIHTDLLEIRNVPCTICQECDHEQIGYQAQSRIDSKIQDLTLEGFVSGNSIRVSR